MEVVDHFFSFIRASVLRSWCNHLTIIPEQALLEPQAGAMVGVGFIGLNLVINQLFGTAKLDTVRR